MDDAARPESCAALPQAPAQQPTQRLPCRGCTRRCRLYQSCKGAPWRSDFAVSVGDGDAGDVA